MTEELREPLFYEWLPRQWVIGFCVMPMIAFWVMGLIMLVVNLGLASLSLTTNEVLNYDKYCSSPLPSPFSPFSPLLSSSFPLFLSSFAPSILFFSVLSPQDNPKSKH